MDIGMNGIRIGEEDMLKILVATEESQGTRENDFCNVKEGEWVSFPYVCDEGCADPDSECGCNRSFMGAISGELTTTAKIANIDVNISKIQYIENMWKTQNMHYDFLDDEKNQKQLFCEILLSVLGIIEKEPVGTIYEIRDGSLYERTPVSEG